MPNYAIDPAPGYLIPDIQDLRLRCLAIIARATQFTHAPGAYDALIRIGGIGEAIDGMCYHLRRYMDARKPVELMLEAERAWMESAAAGSLKGEQPFMEMMKRDRPTLDAAWEGTHHETVAYLNRLGQLLAFAQSRKVDLKRLAPRSWEILVFRNKHAAHRAIDQPREESEGERNQFALAFGQTLAIGHGDILHSVEFNGKPLHLCIRLDHPVVIEETAAWLLALFPFVTRMIPNPPRATATGSH